MVAVRVNNVKEKHVTITELYIERNTIQCIQIHSFNHIFNIYKHFYLHTGSRCASQQHARWSELPRKQQ